MHTPHAQDPGIACTDNNLITTKLPQPYTEYTMFYQLELEYIHHRLLVDKNDPQATTNHEQQMQEALFKDNPLMPKRHRTLLLCTNWYIRGQLVHQQKIQETKQVQTHKDAQKNWIIGTHKNDCCTLGQCQQ